MIPSYVNILFRIISDSFYYNKVTIILCILNIAASVMARHLQQVFSGVNLPDTRYPAPLIPNGPHPIDEASCPITTSTVHHALLKRLSRRKAPGVDHLRTEMLLPIADEVIPIITLLFQLCWKWSSVPSAWCTAQVVPIYKKGDALDPAIRVVPAAGAGIHCPTT
ncbi:hypothetical protein G6F27_013381 [Rhizopus arrhizus]|nr:hypothetical protein G6F27_013381 [Rhizopus arrhizus]